MAIESGRMLDAARAYADAQRQVVDRSDAIGREVPTGLAAPQPAEFSEVLRQSVENVVDGQKAAERQSMMAVAGQADLAEVVAAVANAELTLQTVVSIRDKMVQAYQDIIRMPI